MTRLLLAFALLFVAAFYTAKAAVARLLDWPGRWKGTP